MGTKDIGSDYLPTAAWVRERTDEFARVRMKLARHIALVNKEEGGEKAKVPSAGDEKGKLATLTYKIFKNSVYILVLILILRKLSYAYSVFVKVLLVNSQVLGFENLFVCLPDSSKLRLRR